jgi:hypothetical protein
VTGALRVQRSIAELKTETWEKDTKTRQHRRIALDPESITLLTAVALGVWSSPHSSASSSPMTPSSGECERSSGGTLPGPLAVPRFPREAAPCGAGSNYGKVDGGHNGPVDPWTAGTDELTEDDSGTQGTPPGPCPRLSAFPDRAGIRVSTERGARSACQRLGAELSTADEN